MKTTERPILFSTAMVQAILAGQKTQTRRIVKPQPDDSGLWNDDKFPRALDSTLSGWNGTVNKTGESKEFKCRYGQNGDIIWVRETWVWEGDTKYTDLMPMGSFFYKADFEEHEGPTKWKPSIFMPKAACRIKLEITNIRVERVQDISEEDALAEGIDMNKTPCIEPMNAFAILWDSINKERGYGWGKNSWVWVIEFKRT